MAPHGVLSARRRPGGYDRASAASAGGETRRFFRTFFEANSCLKRLEKMGKTCFFLQKISLGLRTLEDVRSFWAMLKNM